MRTFSLFGMSSLPLLTFCSSSRDTAPSISRSVVCKPTWWHPTFASCRTQAHSTPCKPSRASSQAPGGEEPTPFRSSHLSGTGDSDRAECARRTARLSLRLVCPYSYELRLSGSTVPVATAYFSQVPTLSIHEAYPGTGSLDIYALTIRRFISIRRCVTYSSICCMKQVVY